MITPGLKGDGYLQVSRRVGGGEQFLALVKHDCSSVLRRRVVGMLTELTLVSDGTERYTSREIETDNYEISNKDELELVLLHRSVAAAQSRWYRTKNTPVDLGNIGPYDEPDNATQNQDEDVLKAGCERIAAAYGQRFENGSIAFDRIVRLSTPGKDIIYGLQPEENHPATKAAEAMAALALRSLENVNKPLTMVNPVCGIGTQQGIVVPFARIPGKTPPAVRDQIVDLWQVHIPKAEPLKLFLSDLITVGR